MARSCGDVRAVTAGTAARHASRSRTAPGPILAVRIDLEQYTETYDVHDARATSLAAVLRLGKQAAAEGDGKGGSPGPCCAQHARRSSGCSTSSSHDGREPQEAVAAYGRDHRQG